MLKVKAVVPLMCFWSKIKYFCYILIVYNKMNFKCTWCFLVNKTLCLLLWLFNNFTSVKKCQCINRNIYF